MHLLGVSNLQCRSLSISDRMGDSIGAPCSLEISDAESGELSPRAMRQQSTVQAFEIILTRDLTGLAGSPAKGVNIHQLLIRDVLRKACSAFSNWVSCLALTSVPRSQSNRSKAPEELQVFFPFPANSLVPLFVPLFFSSAVCQGFVTGYVQRRPFMKDISLLQGTARPRRRPQLWC